MSTTRWLVDKSDLARMHEPTVARALSEPIVTGVVAISILTELEMGYSARSIDDCRADRSELVEHLIAVKLP